MVVHSKLTIYGLHLILNLHELFSSVKCKTRYFALWKCLYEWNVNISICLTIMWDTVHCNIHRKKKKTFKHFPVTLVFTICSKRLKANH